MLIPHSFELSDNTARQCGAFQPSPQSFIRLCSATLDLGRAQGRPPGFPDLELSQQAKGQAKRQCAHYPGLYSQEGHWVRQGEGRPASALRALWCFLPLQPPLSLARKAYNPYFSRRKQIEWPEDLSFKINGRALWYQSPCSLRCTIFRKAETDYPKGRFRAPALPEHPLSLAAPPPGWGWGKGESFGIIKFIARRNIKS